MAKNRKSNKSVDRYWNHSRLVQNGSELVHVEENSTEGYIYHGKGWMPTFKKEEHWGKKESCRRCRSKRQVGEFENSLTGLGWLTATGVVMVVIIAIIKFI